MAGFAYKWTHCWLRTQVFPQPRHSSRLPCHISPFYLLPCTHLLLGKDGLTGASVSCYHYKDTGHLGFPPRSSPSLLLCWDRIAPLGTAETFYFCTGHKRSTTAMMGAAMGKGNQKDPCGSSTPSYDSHYPGFLQVISSPSSIYFSGGKVARER